MNYSTEQSLRDTYGDEEIAGVLVQAPGVESNARLEKAARTAKSEINAYLGSAGYIVPFAFTPYGKGRKALYIPDDLLSRAEAQNLSANSPINGFDLRVHFALDDWDRSYNDVSSVPTPPPPYGAAVFQKWAGVGPASIVLAVNNPWDPLSATYGQLVQELYASAGDNNNFTNSVPVGPYADGQDVLMRVTYDAATGELAFFTSLVNIYGPWLQIGPTFAGTPELLPATDDPFTLGNDGFGPLVGHIFRAMLWDEVDGTLLMDFNPETAELDTLNVAGGAGEQWQLYGAASIVQAVTAGMPPLLNPKLQQISDAFTIYHLAVSQDLSKKKYDDDRKEGLDWLQKLLEGEIQLDMELTGTPTGGSDTVVLARPRVFTASMKSVDDLFR